MDILPTMQLCAGVFAMYFIICNIMNPRFEAAGMQVPPCKWWIPWVVAAGSALLIVIHLVMQR